MEQLREQEDLRIRLLIVDDEQSIRKLCVTVGEALGIHLLEAKAARPRWPCSKSSLRTCAEPTW